MSNIGKLFNLKNKVAVVTGGGGHLCSSMVKGLYSSGCYVAVLDSRAEKIKKLKKKISKLDNKKFIGITVDVLNKKNLILVKNEIISKFKKIDIVINGVGINAPTNFFDIKSQDWSKIIESHLTSTLYGCQIFGKEMLKNKKGSIINISSASAGPPLSKAFAYSAAKAGIKNLTQNLGREWGRVGVRVNCVRPGFFPTEWNKKNFLDRNRIAKILNHTPMKRFGKPDELIGAILWLSSDASSFVTGSEITVDGGFSCMTI